jgi:EAL domain-containing protein (putative c-di-GMP-specific phosphodiesterase class I)/CheY-like chemotaxis protein
MMEDAHRSLAGPTGATELSATSTDPSSERPTSVRTVRVLVVDDDPETARGLHRTLTYLKYHVEVAPSGRAALALLGSGSFEVVLSDISMPEMDGFDLIHAIRRIDSQVPIVLLTGEPTVKTAIRALEVGAFRYITKPVDAQELTQVIDKAARLQAMARVKAEAAAILSHRPPPDDRETLAANFNRAIASLWVAFQPIVDAKTKTIYGYEALMRSREPSLPHPGAVLDAAEQLRRLDELGRHIRRLASEAIPLASGKPSIFVNLHVRDLLDPELIGEQSPLLPFADQIVLEVTERASLDEVPDVRQRVAELRRAGFRIAVDDLGAGYAGLTSFALLEPEIVKLDMSLIRDVHVTPTKRKVVRSMTNLARDMGMLVVAEGIECIEERETLIELGCDFLQGYLLAKPAPAFPEIRW